MIKDGTEGTATGPGLMQLFNQYNNWYEAARAYNSGSVDLTHLSNGLGATDSYVSDVTNRLLGTCLAWHVNKRKLMSLNR